MLAYRFATLGQFQRDLSRMPAAPQGMKYTGLQMRYWQGRKVENGPESHRSAQNRPARFVYQLLRHRLAGYKTKPDRTLVEKMMTRFALACAAAVAIAGCAANNLDQTAAAVDTSKMPQAGIFAVKDVVVSEQGQDTLRLAAATTNKFTFAELSAVVWCRAREEAVTRKYDGWYQDGIQQISNGPGQPQTAIATARYFKGKPPEGKKTLKQEKSPCHEVPAVAKAKA
jgi:hypothetical protein